MKCSGLPVLKKFRGFPTLESRVDFFTSTIIEYRSRVKEIKAPMTIGGYVYSLRPNPWRCRLKFVRLESQAVETLNIMNYEDSFSFFLIKIKETFFFFFLFFRKSHSLTLLGTYLLDLQRWSWNPNWPIKVSIMISSEVDRWIKQEQHYLGQLRWILREEVRCYSLSVKEHCKSKSFFSNFCYSMEKINFV